MLTSDWLEEASGSTSPCVSDARCSWTPLPIPEDYEPSTLMNWTAGGSGDAGGEYRRLEATGKKEKKEEKQTQLSFMSV